MKSIRRFSFSSLGFILSLALLSAEEIVLVDRTEELGLSNIGTGPACWVDFNNNGWPDLIVGGRLFINNEGQGFTRIASGLGRVVAADFDNDGWVDLYSYSHRRLYRNVEGQALEQVDILPEFPDDHLSLGASWADFTGNGFVDLYIGGYEHWEQGVTHADILLANIDGERFEVLWKDETDWFRARGVTSSDFNRDGSMAVYVSNYRLTQNRLWIFDSGKIGFVDKAPELNAYGGGEPKGRFQGSHTIGSVWADFDNSGWLDLFVGNFAHPWRRTLDDGGRQPESRFLRNPGPEGDFRFEDMGTGGVFFQESYASPVAGDLNNNGNVDLYFTTVYETASFGIKNNPVLFLNTTSFLFQDITRESGLSDLPATYQAALADFNRNGYLDLITAGRLFENQGGDYRSLRIFLEGDGSVVNRSAIGAQVRIAWNDQTLTRQVEAGTGQGNQNELALHFGLGNNRDPVDLEIFWPGGYKQRIQGVPITETDLRIVFDPSKIEIGN